MYLYENGSAARKLDDYWYEEPAERESTKKVRKQRGTTRTLSRAYGLFLVFMAGLLLTGCIMYLNVRNDITNQQKEIARLESELSNLTMKNNEELDRIEGAVDMEKIKKIAMEELGMTYPASDQVIGIESGAGDYVRQYKEIPEDEKKE